MRDDDKVHVSDMIYRVKCNSGFLASVEKVISSIEGNSGETLKSLISPILQIYTHTNII